jgi:hypothetical protein
MTYLIEYFKKICKCCSVPPPSTTIKIKLCSLPLGSFHPISAAGFTQLLRLSYKLIPMLQNIN